MKDEERTSSNRRTIHVEPGSELERLLRAADITPVELEQRGVRYEVTKVEEHVVNRHDPFEKTDVWTGYDPERLRRALQTSSGALRGVDCDDLKRDLAEQRSQDSAGRRS